MALVLRGEMKTAAIRRAENTRLGYAADWKGFMAWCEQQRLESLPAETATVLLYCHSLLASQRKVATAIRHLSAINSYHHAAGLALPASSEIWQFLLAVRRMRGEQPKQKNALTIDELRRMCDALPATAGGRRDRAMLTLGFGSALRRSNLVALDIADVEVRSEGLVLTIRKEKQDRRGEGRVIGVMRGTHPETCPVLSVESWIEVRGLVPGPLFVPVYAGMVVYRRLQAAHVARIVKKAAAAVGLDARNFAGHSLRSGMVTTALDAGANEVLVMAHTGHRSLMTLRKYYRRVDPFRGNASGKLGL